MSDYLDAKKFLCPLVAARGLFLLSTVEAHPFSIAIACLRTTEFGKIGTEWMRTLLKKS